MPRSGGPVEILLQGEALPRILFDDDAVYVQGPRDGGGSETVRVPKDGSARTSLPATPPMAVGDGYVYFFDRKEDALPEAALVRVPATGGPVERLAAIDPYLIQEVSDVAVDGTHVFWTSARDNRLYRWDGPDGTVTVFAEDQALAAGVAVGDDGYVYWWTASRLARRPASGGGDVEVLATHVPVDGLSVRDGILFFWGSLDHPWGWLDLDSGAFALHGRGARPCGPSHAGQVFWSESRWNSGEVNIHPAGMRSASVDFMWRGAMPAEAAIMTTDAGSCVPPEPVRVEARPATTAPAEEPPCLLTYVQVDGAAEIAIWIGLSSTEYDDVLELALLNPGPVPRDDPRVLSRFPLGRRFPLLTSSGTASAEIVGWSTVYDSSNLQAGYVIQLQAAPGVPPDEGLILTNPAAPPNARLQMPTPLDLGTAVGSRLVESLRSLAPQDADEPIRIEEGHVVAWPARLPSPHAYFVTVDVELDEDEYGEPSNFSGLFLADAGGSVTRTVGEMMLSDVSYRLGGVVDLEGDGSDEIVFRANSCCCSEDHLLRFRDADPELLTIARACY